MFLMVGLGSSRGTFHDIHKQRGYNTSNSYNIYCSTKLTHNIFADAKKFPKLFVTLYIRNATLDYDSQLGSLGVYECRAFAANDSLERKHPFSVTVISSKYSNMFKVQLQ